MQRLLVLFIALLLASCAGQNRGQGPRDLGARSSETSAASTNRGPASRSVRRGGQSRYAPIADYLIVDKSERLLVAYENGKPIRAYRGLQFGDAPKGHKRFQGDERTPEGIYRIDWRNPQSRFHLSLRISYPNDNDRAFASQYGRSPGGDIFIHGQPNQLVSGRMRGDWTDGCIALSNDEIEELWRIVPDGTPIEIRP
ncbi:L,D-transpeptidase family protein [uncultured Erythrobacter sp.]|uniref:L,D-transpeptidase family protein n=1 Tax=uncultured Erythrobacter sp. TaxID=263913 RepID=UPI0026057816|nr:L,D-transpeptidase family protein [uncultured Erythrobacter sp.]